jgi:hypothetical protein
MGCNFPSPVRADVELTFDQTAAPLVQFGELAIQAASVAGVYGYEGRQSSGANKSFKLAATTDGVTFADDPALNGMSDLTVETWVNYAAWHTGSFSTYASKDSSYVCRMDDDLRQLQFLVWLPSGQQSVSYTLPAGVPAFNNWHHVACVMEQTQPNAVPTTTLMIYYDGSLVSSATYAVGGPVVGAGSALTVGNSASGENLDGRLDDFKLWSTPRTAQEICESAARVYANGQCQRDNYDVHYTSGVVVDGALGEWNDVPGVSLADPDYAGTSTANSYTIKLQWDDAYLYLAAAVADTEILTVTTTRDQSQLYRDDVVEFYLDTLDDRDETAMQTDDYHFLLTASNVVGDERGTGTGGDKTWDASAQLTTAVQVNGAINVSNPDVGFTVEMRIPWTDIGVSPTAGLRMGADLSNGDRDGAATTYECSNWAMRGGPWYMPSKWKSLTLVSP